jgi:hypothetical protein
MRRAPVERRRRQPVGIIESPVGITDSKAERAINVMLEP